MTETKKVNAKTSKFNLDDAAILAVTAKISLQSSAELTVSDLAVLAALRRAHPSAGQTPEELGQWLAEMDEGQLRGVVSNTKGVLHEMLFVEMENGDGDSVYAAQFAATNHPGFDIKFVDEVSGHNWSAQMKATNAEPYVREWMEKHPDGEILVTSEIADRIGIESSGISNAELTADTSRFVNTLVDADQNDVIWDYVPALSALSVGVVIWELNERLQRQEITRPQFKWMVARISGKRAARILSLSVLMSIPGVNVITMISLIARNLESRGLIARLDQWIADKNLQSEITKELEHAIFTEKQAIETAIESARCEIETETTLLGNSEIERELYNTAYQDLENLLYPNGKPEVEKRLEYVAPDSYKQRLTGLDSVDEMVKIKIVELHTEREANLARARKFLTDTKNINAFQVALAQVVGSSSAAAINLAIHRRVF